MTPLWTNCHTAFRQFIFLEMFLSKLQSVNPIHVLVIWKNSGKPILGTINIVKIIFYFSIEDVGCCTVLKHIEYGTKCVSGFLFVA